MPIYQAGGSGGYGGHAGRRPEPREVPGAYYARRGKQPGGDQPLVPGYGPMTGSPVQGINPQPPWDPNAQPHYTPPGHYYGDPSAPHQASRAPGELRGLRGQQVGAGMPGAPTNVPLPYGWPNPPPQYTPPRRYRDPSAPHGVAPNTSPQALRGLRGAQMNSYGKAAFNGGIVSGGLAGIDIRRGKKTKSNPYGLPGTSQRRMIYLPRHQKANRGGRRGAMKASLQRMLGYLPSATTKSADPYAIDHWLASTQEGQGTLEESVEMIQDLMSMGVPEESVAQVQAAIGELFAAIEEDQAADDAGAYDEEDAADAYAQGYGYEQDGYEQDDEGGGYEPEYAYAGDEGMGEFKAISPGAGFDDAAQALAEEATMRTMKMLGAQPAIKSIGFQAPYFHTHAPHNDRLAHMKAFDQFIRVGETRMDRMLFEHLQGATKAAMQEDTDSEGGYLLPDEFSKDLIKALYNESWVRQTDYRRITMSHKTLEVPTVVASTRAVRKAEEASVDQKEPTTGVVTFTATAVTQMSKVSRELLADSRFPVWEQVLLPDYKQAFAEGENADFTVGTGSGEPQGCLYGSTLGVTAANPSSFTADEVKALFNALNHKYRGLPSTVWMMADATMGLIRLLKDGQGRYLINGDLSKGEPETLLGKPVIINNGMPAATTGLKPILFGAFTYFGIADRQDMRMQRLEELYAVNRQVGFLADMRNDSRVLLAAAFQHLIMA